MRCQVCGEDNPAEARFCAKCGAALVTAAEPPYAVTTRDAPPAYAGFLVRFGAALVDGIILIAIPYSLRFGFFFILPRLGGPLLYLSVFCWLYFWLFTGLKGQTIGKMIFGIKVIDAQGNRPGLGVAALREILGKTVSVIVFYIGFLWIIWDKQKRGWHDIIANTRVVRVVKTKPEG